ncbi:cytoplasmic peptidase PepQ [Haloferula helveola]|uniref:Cytoplasmic peptidase PepQ n=2 Tax=Haloferula helveola TaxID=490095 RepID=A0ABN6GZP8_9BACT|nr:cytoplasmic peptidase PepQ [Haloferula helveola]
MQARLDAVRRWMADNERDALYVTHPPNVRYLSGFRGEPAALFVDHDRAILITHDRSSRWARAQTSTFEVICDPDPVVHAGKLMEGPALRIGVDHHIPHTTLLSLRGAWNRHTLEPSDGIESLRRIKSEAEIAILRDSQAINERIFRRVLEHIRPGMTERAAQGVMLAEMAADEAVDGPSFTPIVASAGNAWEIHHQPDSTVLRQGDMVILDLGVMHAGYASDMTRTICLGPATDAMREIHSLVGRAQQAAFDAIRHGISAYAADAAARSVIEAAGHGSAFTHGLGHGIGLETHDAGLRMSPSARDTELRNGMAVTVEPGVYLEDRFGVRTEDVVIVREDGIDNLTTFTHELIELPT